MEKKYGYFRRLFILTFLLVLWSLIAVNVSAQDIEPGGFFTAESAVESSIADMKRMEAVLEPLGFSDNDLEIPFRHGMSQSTYLNVKEAISLSVGPNPRRAFAEETDGPLAPPLLVGSIAGVNQSEAGGLYPPDTHGAIGHKSGIGYVEVTNSHIDIYRMDSGARLQSFSLASFFGYTRQTIFDPRCVYDPVWNRWIVTAEAFPESATEQIQFIAVSKTDNPLLSWYIYSFDVNTNDNDDFWDFPQVGFDQDAVIITANVFGSSSFRDARVLAIAKARLYNGLSFNVPLFSGLPISIAPPIVLDQNPRTYLLQAPQGGNSVRKYTMRESSRPGATTLTPSSILVPSYTMPPNAGQPGTSAQLDTLDARFGNNSIQFGDSIWNVHCVNVGGLPTPKWYEFDTEGVNENTVKSSGSFQASATSNDWMPHLAANPAGDIFVAWSSTDPNFGINVQLRISGKRSADAGIPSGTVVFQSPTFSTQFRWGDYQSVSLDPTNPDVAYFVGETVINSSTWGTRIGKMRF